MSTSKDTHWRSLIKAVSWRTTGTIDTFIISYIVTGKVALAGSIASIEVLTKILLYYGHERVWSFIPWGRKAPVAAAAPSGEVVKTPGEPA